MSRSVK